MIRRFCLLFIFIVVCVFAYSQNPSKLVYNINNGLNSNEVYDIHQDSLGYIWIASAKGLSKYNGKEFRHYTTKDGLKYNDVFEIYEERKGKLWFSSFNSLACFENGELTPYQFNNTLAQYFKRGNIINFLNVNSNGISFCTQRSLRVNITNKGKIKIDSTKHNQLEINLAENYMRAKSTTKKGYLIVDNKHFYSDYVLNNKTTSLNIRFLERDSFSTIYASVNYSIIAYNKKRNLSFEQRFEYDILCFYPLSKNRFLIGTSEGLKVLYNTGDSLLIESSYFNKQTITSIIKDKEGTFWVSTLNEGIFQIPSLHSKLYFAQNGGNNFSKLKTGKNKLLIINKSGSSHLIDTTNNIESIQSSNKDFIDYNDAIYLEQQKSFLAVADKGYYSIISNQKTEAFQFPTSQSRRASLKSIYQFNDSIFIATNSGVQIYKLINTAPYLIYNRTIKKDMWFSKVIFYNQQAVTSNRQTINYLKNKKKQESFNLSIQHPISDIDTFRNGLVIGTEGEGVIIYLNNKKHKVNSSSGLLTDYINSCFVENDTSIWLASNKGLSRLIISDSLKITIKNYGTEVGLQSLMVRDLAIFNKKLWVITNDNLYCLEAESMKPTFVPAPIYITKFKVADSSYSLSNKHPILEPNPQLVEIHFDVLSYRPYKKSTYFVSLISKKSTQSFTTSSTSIEFPFIESGKYTLAISQVNEEGATNTKKAILHFEVKPIWYTKPLALIGFFILFLMVVSILLWWRISVVKKQEHKKRQYEVRTAQLELKALQAQMNPHFIFNVLSSIQYYIYEHKNEEAEQYLLKFTTLIRQVLEFSEKRAIQLKEELECLENYLELERMRKSNSFDFSIHVDASVDSSALIPPLIFQPFAENSIWHGLKKKDKGILDVYVNREGNDLLCKIMDNGIGIEASRKMNMHNKTSMGSRINKERIEIWSKSFNKKVDYNIQTIYKNNEVAGTEVSFRLPNILKL